MQMTTTIPLRFSNAIIELRHWLRQMRVALNRPIKHDVGAGHVEFARMIESGIEKICRDSLDPRI